MQKILERHIGSLGDKYEKTYALLILNFAPIKKFDIYNKNYNYWIELSTVNCIIHNDRNSPLPAMSKSNMD